MRYRSLDHLNLIDSPVRRLPASLKMTGALLLLIGIMSVPRSAAVVLFIPFLILTAIIIVGRLPLLFLLRRLLFLEPFAIAASTLALLQPDGWTAFGIVAARSTLSLTAVLLLSAATPFTEMLAVLRRLHMPFLLVTTIALLYRYLFILVEQAERMRRAREARTMTRGRRSAWFLRSSVIGYLTIRSMERAERVYAAMRARGWS